MLQIKVNPTQLHDQMKHPVHQHHQQAATNCYIFSRLSSPHSSLAFGSAAAAARQRQEKFSYNEYRLETKRKGNTGHKEIGGRDGGGDGQRAIIKQELESGRLQERAQDFGEYFELSITA